MYQTMSEKREIAFGIPQVSILEPLLFIHCVNNLHSILFADTNILYQIYT